MTRYGTWPICAVSTVKPMTDSDIDALISEATKGIPDEEASEGK